MESKTLNIAEALDKAAYQKGYWQGYEDAMKEVAIAIRQDASKAEPKKEEK